MLLPISRNMDDGYVDVASCLETIRVSGSDLGELIRYIVEKFQNSERSQFDIFGEIVRYVSQECDGKPELSPVAVAERLCCHLLFLEQLDNESFSDALQSGRSLRDMLSPNSNQTLRRLMRDLDEQNIPLFNPLKHEFFGLIDMIEGASEKDRKILIQTILSLPEGRGALEEIGW